MKVRFLLSKDPTTGNGGDVTMSRLAISLARESHTVAVTALTDRVDASSEQTSRIPKPSVRRQTLRFLANPARSFIHSRYDTGALRVHLREQVDDRFVAEHSYMAESFLHSGRGDAAEKLCVNTQVSEADVWRSTRPSVIGAERYRIAHDQDRVGRASRAVGVFDASEVRHYEEVGARRVQWLNLTLPPRKQINVRSSAPVVVFLGDRTWGPNAEGATKMLQLWPKIHEGIPSAELWIIGREPVGGRRAVLPDGVVDHGFVRNLGELLGCARVLVAPIATGGGVRVKVLEAATVGLPIVGTSSAIGSLKAVLPIHVAASTEELVESSRRMLKDSEWAGLQGDRVYDENRSRWSRHEPHSTMEKWLDS